MNRLRRMGATCAAVMTLLTVGPGIVSAAQAASDGPALLTPVAKLAAALKCDQGADQLTKTPVLFVPGTTVNGDENFAWNYVAALRGQGHPVCWVDYPQRGWRDMQTTAEYVVHAIRTMHERFGRKISTVGHSQGGLQPVWALRFWPDLAGKVDDEISLGSPYQGTTVASLYCTLTAPFFLGCPESFWQFRKGSNWSKAVLAKPLPAGPSYSSIYTTSDEFAFPGKEASVLPGAAHVGVQDVCPGRLFPLHLSMAVDAVSYRLVLDALNHDGPADPARVAKSVCGETLMPIDVPELFKQLPKLVTSWIFANLESRPWPMAEPPLRDYAK